MSCFIYVGFDRINLRTIADILFTRKFLNDVFIASDRKFYNVYTSNSEMNHIYQVVGAFWYLFAIERQDRCWHDACTTDNCHSLLYCREGAGPVKFLTNSCDFLEPSEIKNLTDFDFGIFLDALKSRIVEKGDFPKKFFYCFWWGLRSLRLAHV